jgi:hypothetical protein
VSATWRRTYRDGAAHPETGGQCQVDVPHDGAAHDGPHVYTAFMDGEPDHPVYWSDAS